MRGFCPPPARDLGPKPRQKVLSTPHAARTTSLPHEQRASSRMNRKQIAFLVNSQGRRTDLEAIRRFPGVISAAMSASPSFELQRAKSCRGFIVSVEFFAGDGICEAAGSVHNRFTDAAFEEETLPAARRAEKESPVFVFR